MNTLHKNNGHNDWNNAIGKRVKGLTKEAYGRTKYGGVLFGLVQEIKTIEWACQICAEIQGSDLPSYMFEFSEKEFIRICSICQAEKLLHHVKTLQDLIEIARKSHWEYDTS